MTKRDAILDNVMSAGRLTICLSLCYGVTFHLCVCVARLAAVKSFLAVLGFTWLSPQCALIVSRFCCTFSPFKFVFYFYIFIYILLLFTSWKMSASPLHADLASSQREPPHNPPNPNGFRA